MEESEQLKCFAGKHGSFYMLEKEDLFLRLNFFKAEQKLSIFTVLLMLVCIMKLDLSKISTMKFVSVEIL